MLKSAEDQDLGVEGGALLGLKTIITLRSQNSFN